MKSVAQDLIRQGDHLFSERAPLVSLWQEVAENFYPERADFTVQRSMGDEFADHLMTSYPVLIRRDLANAFSAMCRPTAKSWFSMRAAREELEDHAAKEWLEAQTATMRRAMYDRATQFTRATKEADHDYAAFGQAVISVELNRRLNTLLYRTWHLRDVAWCESADGAIDTVHRKWRPTARDLLATFRHVAPAVRERAEKEPYCRIECRHVVIPAEYYSGERRFRQPFVSIHIDVENQHVMEEEGIWNSYYVVPRWQTVSGSQYAHSPATIIALPEARLIQAITGTLLEAGEKAVNPPMVATQEVVRSDINIFAGGVTWVDAEYDERLGEALRPISQDISGLPVGIEMQDRAATIIKEAFYLNRLNLPPLQGGDKMTAYEVGQRVQEYIRQAMPLFEPLEAEYNAQLCEITSDILLRNGAFGPLDDIPASLRGAEIRFQFESPLHDAIEAQQGQKLLEASALVAQAAQHDPSILKMIKWRGALRDALSGIKTPTKWTVSEDEMDEIAAQEAAQAQAQQVLAGMGQAAAVAETLGKAGKSLAEIPEPA